MSTNLYRLALQNVDREKYPNVYAAIEIWADVYDFGERLEELCKADNPDEHRT